MKRLVVCCDGTWNRPDQESPTNVAKLALAVDDAGHDGTSQHVFYHRGVGTDRFERIRGGALGLGLSRHVCDCYRFVVAHYERGDELFFFGFSRGAYTARSTVGLIRNAGVLRPEHSDRVEDAYRLYRGGGDARHPTGIESRLFRASFSYDDVRIRFVGVWDTVGVLGIPGVPRRLAGRLWAFHDTQLSSAVERAYQALAIDERRAPFVPSLWYRQPGDEQVLEQYWFAGVHSDVGGGYEDCALAEITLLWIAGKAQASGLALRPDHLARVSSPAREQRRLGVQVAPDVEGEIHESRTGAYTLLPAHTRSLLDPNGRGGVAVSSTARDRSGYRPPNLHAYLDANGPVGETSASGKYQLQRTRLPARRSGRGRDAQGGWPSATLPGRRAEGETRTPPTLVEAARSASADAGSIPPVSTSQRTTKLCFRTSARRWVRWSSDTGSVAWLLEPQGFTNGPRRALGRVSIYLASERLTRALRAS